LHGVNAEAAIAAAEARCDAAGEPARFHTFDETSPPGFVVLLRRRGYGPGEPRTTMFKHIDAVGAEARDHAWIVCLVGFGYVVASSASAML